jgi:ATP-dependent helicase/DNAse subunit B
MPLTLVLGPANSAKAGEVLGAYAAAAERGAWLVVPNASDAIHYRRELAEQGVVLGSVVTFTGLIEEIALRTGYAGRRVTALQREQLVARAVRATKLDALSRAGETGGFIAAAQELISELERSLVSAERFTRAMERWAADSPGRAPYAREVAALYSAYGRELDRSGRVDAELFTWRALDSLRASPGRWGSEAVFFYGFDDLHPLQLDAVETLARVAGAEVMISLTYEAGRAALRARAEVVEELRPLAERVIELPAVDEYYEAASRPVLHHLERRLFELDPVPERIVPGRAVRLLEAAGERAEAELVATEVLALLDSGVAADEIAVVHRSPAAAVPALARVFAEYRIPLAFEHRLALRAIPLGQGLLGLARCALLPEDQSSADDLLRYLRAPGALRRPELADALELEVRCKGLRTVDQARARTPLALAEIDALASAKDPGAELLWQGRKLLAAPHRGAAPLLDGDEQLDARALSALAGALDELAELGLRLDGDELIQWLETLEVDARCAPGPGAVLLSDPLSIRARRFVAVFICGLQEEGFPQIAAPEPFLSDELRRELAASSGLRLRQRGDALERERYLFYSALSRATGGIVLSYRSADEEGNLQLPSPFIADVAELLADGWADRRRKRLLGDLVWRDDEAPTQRERDRFSAASAAPASAASASAAARPPRRLSANALTRVRHTEVVSAGALESYADCPVKWLVERELQPRALEPDSESLLRGSYMHDVLEQLLKQLGRAVTPESLPEALEILDRLLAEHPPEIAPGRSEQLRRATAEAIAADLRRYLRHEAATGCGWEPLRLELRFGFDDEEESLPALQLGDGPDRIAVRGAIDRVDVAPDGRRAAVRDYKSGGVRTEYQGGRWSSERRLQVALYMLAVRQLMGLEPVAGLYQPLGGRDLRARGVFLAGEPVGGELVVTDARDRQELDDGLKDAAERAITLARRLRSGELEPCPETCSRGGCAYPGICRAT